MTGASQPKARFFSLSRVTLGCLTLLCLGLVLSAVNAEQPALSPTVAEQSRPACLVSDGATVHITVELAHTSEQRRQGLMGRGELPPNAGMLFQYNTRRPADHGFWMYRTLIPLDIAYLEENGTIVAINRMYPCPSDSPGNCPTYQAGAAFSGALEMNQGFFAQNGIEVGDRFSLGPVGCEEYKERPLANEVR